MNAEVLKKILERTEGCLAILVNGFDGYGIEEVWRDDLIESRLHDTVAVAEYASVLELAIEKSRENGHGELSEMTISSEKANFLIRILDDDRFIAMILSEDGNVGRGRYELREAALALEPELVV